MLIYLEMIEGQEDQTRFEQVYRRYRKLLFLLARQILDNDEDAEEAVVEAFLSIAENIDRISDPVCGKTRAYVAVIAKHKAIDLLRERDRRPAVELEENVDAPIEPSEDAGVLIRAILRLPPLYQRAILLKYDSGFSNSEVGEILGLSYEGVHSLLRRAKEKLRKLLEEEGMSI